MFKRNFDHVIKEVYFKHYKCAESALLKLASRSHFERRNSCIRFFYESNLRNMTSLHGCSKIGYEFSACYLFSAGTLQGGTRTIS